MLHEIKDAINWRVRPEIRLSGLLPSAVWELDPVDNRIMLTFDDGPNPTVTPILLDQLDQNGFKATFFMIGANAVRYPDIARDVVKRGHTIGYHTMFHEPLIRKSFDWIQEDFENFCNATSYIPSLIRAPYGIYTRSLVQFASVYDKQIVIGRGYPRDKSAINSQNLLLRLNQLTCPGAIFILHDGDMEDTTMERTNLTEAFPNFLYQLRLNRYKSSQ